MAPFLLVLGISFGGVPAAAGEQGIEGENPRAGDGGGQALDEELAFSRAAITALDHYMVALKAVHRWRDAVTPVEKRRRSRLLRRELGGSEAADLALAQRKWREAQAVLEGAPVSRGTAADLQGAFFQGIQRALAAVGDFRLVGAELDPEFLASGSLKLCLADERMLQAVIGLRQFLTSLQEDPEAAELLTLHGTDLELHAAYLRAKGCH